MNVPLLLVGLTLLVATWICILSDIRVRTLRSVLLLAASTVMTLMIWASFSGWAAFVLGAASGAVLALPALLRHPLVLSLKSDAEMVQRLGDIDRELVALGKQLRQRDISSAEYEKRLSRLYVTTRNLRGPDDEWAKVVRDIEAELSATLNMVRRKTGKGGELEEMNTRRAMVREHYRELVHRRARFFA
jgi:hypothetical protein